MKRNIYIFSVLLLVFLCVNQADAQQTTDEIKKDIIALYNSNNLQEAYSMINKITEKERDYEIWYILGNISQDLSNDTNAAFYLKKSIILNPAFDKAHYNLGNIYLKEKKYNTAIKEYKEAVKYKKDFAFYYYNMGCAYIGLKDYKEAKSAFEKAIKIDSTVSDFYYNLAYVCRELGKEKDEQKAIESYNKLKENEEN